MSKEDMSKIVVNIIKDKLLLEKLLKKKDIEIEELKNKVKNLEVK